MRKMTKLPYLLALLTHCPHLSHSIDVDEIFLTMKQSIFHRTRDHLHINVSPFFKFNYTSSPINFEDKSEPQSTISINGFYGEYGKQLHIFEYNYSVDENSTKIEFNQEVNSKSSSSKIFLPLIYHSKEHYNSGVWEKKNASFLFKNVFFSQFFLKKVSNPNFSGRFAEHRHNPRRQCDKRELERNEG